MVYITTSGREEAERIATALVEEKLAACANIFPEISSIYRWDGKTEQSGETVLIVKSRTELFPHIEKRVKALHSYDCPCIVAWPITQGNPDFLRWINRETGGSG